MSLQQLEELLAETLGRTPVDREPYLDKACRTEPELRRELAELLALHDEAAEYFDNLTLDIGKAAALEIESAARPRMSIGSYKTLEAIGHGGMGAVYRAERVDGEFEQQVALKLLHRDMDSPQLRARFLAERQLLARLSHPHIERLLDGGVTEEGRPFFAMEHIEGMPITRYCAENNLPAEGVLRLFLDVIDAVSYLHRNLVVHRDLKPSNILVDQNGQVKLLDFGIAKMLAEVPEAADLTRTGEQLMTPEYAAPEQLDGEPVTTSTDVYSLGVVLYELLSGERPHERTKPHPQLASRELPPTPSAKLHGWFRHRGATAESEAHRPRAVSWRRVAGDLDTICLMALRPEPEARYQSAEQLGQDIKRHLEGLPVHARKGSLWYRLLKLVRRRRRALAAAAALVTLVGMGFVRERTLRSKAEQARAEEVVVSGFLGDVLTSADPKRAKGRDITVNEVLEQAADRINGHPEIVAQPAVEAAIRETLGVTYTALGEYDEAREHLERAVELRGGLEARGTEALDAAAELGVVYHRLGRFGEAEQILRRVLRVKVETLGEDHPDVLITQTQLADLYWDQGRLDEVETIDRRSLEIRRRVLGEDHPDTLKSLNGVATTLFSRARYAEAEQYFEQALASAERLLGEDHPHTLMLCNNLAATLRMLGGLERAETLLRKIVAARTRVLGEDHGETAMSVNNLGLALYGQARYAEAEEQFERAAAVYDRLAKGRRRALDSRFFLAQVYHRQGRLEEARALMLSVLERQHEELGPDDIDTLRTQSGLARLKLDAGNLGEAEAAVLQILEPLREAQGEAHPNTLACQATLARIRIEQGRFADALEISAAAVESGSQHGAEPLSIAAVGFEQARALAGLDRAEEAREVAARVLAVRTRVLGADHPETVAVRNLIDEL